MQLADRLAGAVWGHLVGDALGVPYEFKTPSQIGTVVWRGSGTHKQPAGTWSDDGSLMLAALDSLLRGYHVGDPQFDTSDQARRFLEWSDQGAYTPDGEGKFDIGMATSAALDRLRMAVPAEEAGGAGERDQGNGSLMRILPVALIGRDLADAELVDHAHRSSAITHRHPVPQATCALYVLIARNLLQGQARAEALAQARRTLGAIYDARADGEPWRRAMDTIDSWRGRSGRGYVVDSFWSAWDALAGARTYRAAIENAVQLGRDTDTTACIAGGLAGIRFGVTGIPSEWRNGLRGRDIVEPLITLLCGPVLAASPAPAPTPTPQGARTSESNPIRVDWIDGRDVPRFAGVPGRLGMTFLPGKHDLGSAGR